MSAEINVIVERKNDALLVPLGAIHDGRAWVVAADGRLRQRTVQVGIRDLTMAEILGGIAEGEQVVVGSPREPVEGARASARRPSEAAPTLVGLR